MSKRPSRLYDAQYMADAVQHHAKLQAQAMKVAPHAFGPMSRIPMQIPAATEIETLPAHCFTCKGKSEFEVDPAKTRTMKNGALLKQGKCKGDKCGQTLSAFTAGTKEGKAA
jgi:hypothetical protein